MVIPGVMDDLVLPQGRYSESFMLISLLELCQEWLLEVLKVSQSKIH